ncbi:uncharacterized protein I303_106573 [Kwoniella dejecticola CBS 10117]|uniref:Uncharacterized protein n=1 Tax=Kwoniella dejecticola CBS 10117 TaxID=1296121 RepID=A0A1A5ZUC1_9TREE|nr:uncharacterized protein I303_08170 [Kwoniella dejecticola CBS 10117]OBR81400.1 hypothetical protein I303_08170 [Kwoniella dejecticola CBS 10117]
MHPSSLTSPESGPSSRRFTDQSSSSPSSSTEHSNSNSGYSSDHEHDEQGSPTESEKEFMSSSTEDFSFSPESKPLALPAVPSASSMHTPPSTSSSQASSSSSDIKPLSSRYPKIFANPPTGSSASRARVRGLSPLTSTTTQNRPNANEFTPRLPKSQPLSRALFNRSLTDSPPNGLMAGGKKKTSQKLVVPTKAFRTTFELGLSASEFARRS